MITYNFSLLFQHFPILAFVFWRFVSLISVFHSQNASASNPSGWLAAKNTKGKQPKNFMYNSSERNKNRSKEFYAGIMSEKAKSFLIS